jgi:IstB-like ATP binding protein
LKLDTVPKCRSIDERGSIPIARHGAIILPSNQSCGQWAEVFGEAIVATAILDRRLHHSHVINSKGDSSRLKEKQRAGRLTKAPAPDTLSP